MSLVGNLKDLGLAEILQIVSLSRKSGVLSIRNTDQDAKIIFRQGLVVKATASTYPVDLHEVFQFDCLVESLMIDSAESLQMEEGFSRTLCEILISEMRIDPASIEKVFREVVANTVYSLFEWEEGTFDFDLQENPDKVDDLRHDTLQYTLENGHNPQFLAMEGSRKLDETRHAAFMADTGKKDDNVEFEFDLLPDTVERAIPQEAEPVQLPTHPTRRLILVEDDDTTRNCLSEFLGRHGYNLSCLGRAEDALIAVDTYCREGESPLLLVDLVMPRMDGTGLLGGLELIELIHANFSQLPALVMTDRRDLQAERALARMGYPLVVKPSPDEITSLAHFEPFAERLLLYLSNLETGECKFETPTFNIGDDLRLEMGEGSLSAVPVAQSTGISLLRGMLEELNDPALGGGIILLVLRFASEFMSRAVIFTVKGDEIVGLGQFGVEDRDLSGDTMVRSLKIPLSEKSIFSEVVETQLPVKLQMNDSRWCNYLLKNLGGEPREVFLGPLVSEGKVVAILYGDNINNPGPIGDTDSLEIFLSQAGIAMEKGLLQRRLKEKHLEGL